MMCRFAAAFLFAPFLFAAWGCGISYAQDDVPVVNTVSFAELPGWAKDTHADAFQLFHRSCAHVVKAKKQDAAFIKICALARTMPPKLSNADARHFFETNFTLEVLTSQNAGLMTGYYEPEFLASRQQTDEFHVPMLRRPRDLVANTSPPGHAELNAARKMPDGSLQPYFDRAAIEDGALNGQGLELYFMRNPFDLFTLQVQGSGRLKLEGGGTARIAYDGKNGQPYTAIGKTMIERGLLKRGGVSMQTIGAVLNTDPVLAADIMRSNKSYVFFKEIKGHDAALGPFGAQGVPLMPMRSIAIDASEHLYGTPFFIDGVLPGGQTLQMLTIAQDTGSAIKGRARIDLFTGWGAQAGHLAGLMQQPIALYRLKPKT